MKKTYKRMITIIILCAVVLIPIAFLIKALYFPVIYPTKSSSQKLTIVNYSGFLDNRPVITLRHFVEGRHIADYVLAIEKGVREQEPQAYSLPKFEEGALEVNVDLGGDTNGSFAITYNQASNLYGRGLLVYLYTDFSNYSYVEGRHVVDRYVHFISGESKICYFRDKYASLNKEGYSPEWSIVMENPRLKMIPRDIQPYLVTYSGWRENEWVIKQVDG